MALTYIPEDFAAQDKGRLGPRVARAGRGHAGARITANLRPSQHRLTREPGQNAERGFAPMPTSINYADV